MIPTQHRVFEGLFATTVTSWDIWNRFLPIGQSGRDTYLLILKNLICSYVSFVRSIEQQNIK